VHFLFLSRYFHPRWLYDWDEKPLKESWVIAYEKGSEDELIEKIPVANNSSTLGYSK